MRQGLNHFIGWVARTAACLVVAVSAMAAVWIPGSAGALTHIIKTDVALSGERAAPFPFELEMNAFTEGNDVVLTITNNGADWPKYTLVGVYYAHGMGVVANRRVKLKSGESITLRGQVSPAYRAAMLLRVTASWLDQEFVVQTKVGARPPVEQAERATTAPSRH